MPGQTLPVRRDPLHKRVRGEFAFSAGGTAGGTEEEKDKGRSVLPLSDFHIGLSGLGPVGPSFRPTPLPKQLYPDRATYGPIWVKLRLYGSAGFPSPPLWGRSLEILLSRSPANHSAAIIGWVISVTPPGVRKKRRASSAGSSPTTRPSGILTPRSTTTRRKWEWRPISTSGRTTA